MQAQRCPNGHYYDPSQYSSCPYCRSAQPSANATVAINQQPAQPSAPEKPKPKAPTEDGATVRLIVQEMGRDPVVGWLVCTGGPERGQDYRLRAGNNYLGRDKAMDISIKADDTISRENHLVITYDRRHKRFYVAMGAGREVVYVNDQPVLSGSVPLKAGDVIEVGKTTLLFVPLCGEDFEWDDDET